MRLDSILRRSHHPRTVVRIAILCWRRLGIVSQSYVLLPKGLDLPASEVAIEMFKYLYSILLRLKTKVRLICR